MADANTGISLWQVLAPVIVGGLIGVTGSLIGPWLIQDRKEAAEKKQRRAEKFEELVTALFELHHWINKMRNVRVFGEERDLEISPSAKVQAISSVYFPEFEKEIRALDLAADGYELWAMKAANKRLKKESGITDGGNEAYEPFMKKFHTLMGTLREYSRKEFQ